MTRYYCTYFDRNYLIKAAALIESLNRHEKNNFTLYAVCLDEISRTIIDKLKFPNVVTIPMHRIEEGDSSLIGCTSDRSLVEYYWTCTSSIILRILDWHPEIDVITYLDADLFFYSSPDPIFEELGNKSVLIHEHRFSPSLIHLEQYGKYNVGLLCFRNDESGKQTLQWWRDRCIEWCRSKPEDGKFGDQLYLNEWTVRFGNVAVLENIGAGVAPWNHEQYKFHIDSSGSAFVNDRAIVFYHFHSLAFVTPDVIIPARVTCYPLTFEVLMYCYVPYINALTSGILKVRTVLPDFVFGLINEDILTKDNTFISRKGLIPESKLNTIPQYKIRLNNEWDCFCSAQIKENSDANIEVHKTVTGIRPSSDFLVSALVSTFNSDRFLRGCLEDLENQTISDQLEIIVVNSGSEQDEEKIVREFQKKYPNIRYIKTDNREPVYAAWNRGIKLSSGKYITNANTDDRHRTDAYEQMVKVLENKPEIALVYADVIVTEKENETFDNYSPVGQYRWLEWDREKLLNSGCFMGPQPMWRRVVHDEYGYFDGSLITSGDYEFWLRISQTNDFMHIPEFLGLYLKSDTSIEHSNRGRQRIENEIILDMYRDADTSGILIRRFYSDNHDDLIEIHNKAGERLFNSGRIKQAEYLFHEILSKNPGLTGPLNNLGVIAFRYGRIDEAVYYFKRVLAIDNNHSEAKANLACCMESK